MIPIFYTSSKPGALHTHDVLFLGLTGLMGLLALSDFLIYLPQKLPSFAEFQRDPSKLERMSSGLRCLRIATVVAQVLMIGETLGQLISHIYDAELTQLYIGALCATAGCLLFIALFYTTLLLLIALAWLLYSLALLLYFCVALLLCALTCGRLNLFSKFLPCARRPRRLSPKSARGANFEAMKRTTSKPWHLHAAPTSVTECAICLSAFEPQHRVLGLPCRQISAQNAVHYFHEKCAQKWFKNHRACPLCRADMAPRFGLA